MNFDLAFNHLMASEGYYSDHPSDPGGKTTWGVTEAVARANGYDGEMRDMPQSIAKSIARRHYWDAVFAENMPDEVRFPLFDAAYHSGPPQAILWLQRAAMVDADGVIGPKTMAAVRANPALVVRRMTGERLRFLAGLKTWPQFGKGWTRRIAANLMEE